MITPDYVVTMARYNAWQNKQIKAAMERLSDADLRAERGAFFGSILATANHLLWGDQIWMARFEGSQGPAGSVAESIHLTPDIAAWGRERMNTDARIINWADALRQDNLEGDLKWYSGVSGRERVKPRGLLIAHMFNHQTHHRGQIHAMLTAAGQKPGDTDLIFMPSDDRVQ